MTLTNSFCQCYTLYSTSHLWPYNDSTNMNPSKMDFISFWYSVSTNLLFLRSCILCICCSASTNLFLCRALHSELLFHDMCRYPHDLHPIFLFFILSFKSSDVKFPLTSLVVHVTNFPEDFSLFPSLVMDATYWPHATCKFIWSYRSKLLNSGLSINRSINNKNCQKTTTLAGRQPSLNSSKS